MKVSTSFALLLFASSALLVAQPAQKSILGTVTRFKVDAHTTALEIQADHDTQKAVPFGAQTEVVRVAPGQHDLSGAEKAQVTDIVRGDRVMVTFVDGAAEARR